jgi:hypothetical protein
MSCNADRLSKLSNAAREMAQGTGVQLVGLQYLGVCILPHPERDGYEMRITVERPVHRVFFEHDELDDDATALSLLSETCKVARVKLAAELRTLADKMDLK